MQHVNHRTKDERPTKRAKLDQSSVIAALNTVLTVETTASGIAARNEAEVARMVLKMKYADWEYIGDNLNTNSHYDVELVSRLLTARSSRVECPTFMTRRDRQAFATILNKNVVERSRLSDVGVAFLALNEIDLSYIANCLRLCWRARRTDRQWIRNRVDTDCMFSLAMRPYGLSLDKVSIVLSAIGFRIHDTLTDIFMIPDRISIDKREHDLQYDICVYIGHALDDCALPTVESEFEDY